MEGIKIICEIPPSAGACRIQVNDFTAFFVQQYCRDFPVGPFDRNVVVHTVFKFGNVFIEVFFKFIQCSFGQ